MSTISGNLLESAVTRPSVSVAAATPQKPRVLMVCTRRIPKLAGSGRERTMAFILNSLEARGDVHQLHLPSLLERRSLRAIAQTSLWAARQMMKGQLVPLQSMLFRGPSSLQQISQAVQELNPETVYFDGVRSGGDAVALRRRFPKLRIVCDFDDLMSRRTEALAREREPISMGYLKQLVPAWFQRYVLDGLVARSIQAYEYRALRREEQRICKVSDSVVLVSSVDAAHLMEHCPDAPVETIPPYMDAIDAPAELEKFRRFIFIGSDSLLQNRKSIEYLLALWSNLKPDAELHIYGKQHGQYGAVNNVTFHGFVADIADAYLPGSILLAPSFVSGGVKTKVLEAMSFGVLPLGTQITFEGVDADCASLTCTSEELVNLVQNPHVEYSRRVHAGLEVIKHVARNHSAPHLAHRWCNVVWN